MRISVGADESLKSRAFDNIFQVANCKNVTTIKPTQIGAAQLSHEEQALQNILGRQLKV